MLSCAAHVFFVPFVRSAEKEMLRGEESLTSEFWGEEEK